MTKRLSPKEFRLPPAAAASLRRILRGRSDGGRGLTETAGVSYETLVSAAAEVPIRRGSRLAIERMLAEDPEAATTHDLEGAPDAAAS